jgi:hypothetical protein
MLNFDFLFVCLVPESCADFATCFGTSTDGEYWLYPKVTNGQRVKVYCHNMGMNPTEYITLKYANTFVQHDGSNWVIHRQQCRTDYKPPLKLANFSRVAINIQVIFAFKYILLSFISAKKSKDIQTNL